MRVHRSVVTLFAVVAMLAGALVVTPAHAATFAVASATPSGPGASRSVQIEVAFTAPIVPSSFAGSINGAPFVPTQVVVAPDATHVRIDPGELEYTKTYDVVVAATVRAAAGGTLGADYPFSFTVAANPTPKRPTTSVVVPSGPFTAGQSVTLSGQASGYVWQRDANNPLALRHWDHDGNDVGDGPMLHPTVLYFPAGIDGYKFYLYYTPYPGAEDPVVMRSNDGVHFDATGVPHNPIFTYGMQPPYDLQNLADPEAVKVGDTWMLFYEMETPADTAASIGTWMHGGGYIGLALSSDGVGWTPYGGSYTYDDGNPPTAFPANGNPVVAPEESVSYEAGASKTGEPAVVFKDGVFHMWRTVIGNGSVVAHDHATDPRGPWTKDGVAIDTAGGIYGPHPDVVYDAERDQWRMVYLSTTGQLAVATAASPDGPWTQHPLNPVFSASGGWEGSTLYRSAMVQVDGQWYLYYSANPGGSGQIGLAREVPGVRRVEVSTDDGHTWRPASVAGNGTWSISWTPPANGAYKIRARVVDDFMVGDTTAPTTVDVGAGALQPPAQPILLVTDKSNAANPFNGYLAEIMRAEGLVEFQQVDLSALMSSTDPAGYLAAFDEVVLAQSNLDATAKQRLRDYVNGGGHLVAMRPDKDLADLFGLTYDSARPEQLLEYFGVDTTQGPGTGITSTSLQYHGEADNYSLNGASALAKLYDTIDTASSRPAASIVDTGRGRAAAFTFDLAKSVVLTRQGNPAWKDQDGGDGLGGYRPEDLFVNSAGQAYLSPTRTRIPQADEAQRFFANLVLSMLASPMPRMWYLPGTHTSLIVNTGDGEDLGEGALAPVISDANSYGGTYTSYLRESGIDGTSVATEAAWRAAGNENSVHGYGDRTLAGMTASYAAIVAQFEAKFGHAARTARNHTIAWTGWSDMAAIEAANGVELDTNYYHYMNWLLGYGDNANGWFTGSGLPQKFSDEQGNVLPIYQALTEWPDEWFADNGVSAAGAFNIMKSMLDASDNGFYSAFVANIHHVRYNNQAGDPTHDWANMLWAYARDHGIPMWSAEKLADFVEARDGSQFRNVAWNGTTLTFDFSTTKAGQPLTIMVPAEQGSSQLLSVHVGGAPVSFTEKTIKGRNYAMVTTSAASTSVVAAYGLDTTAPAISNVKAAQVTDTAATITWNTDEAADSQVEYGPDAGYGTTTPIVHSLVTAHSVQLTGLDPKTGYHFRVHSTDGAGNPAHSGDITFTTGSPRWTETSAADFSDGTMTSSRVQPEGAVTLATTGTVTDEFEGSTLDPATWTVGSWSGTASATVAGGALTVANSTYVKSQATFSRETISGRVTFTDGANAHFGLATALNSGDDGITDPHWMIFTAKNGQILARTRTSDGLGEPGGEINTVLGGVTLGVPHDFQIVWSADDTVEFFVDGYLVATHHRTFNERMRAYVAGSQAITVDSVSVSGAFASSGLYTSSVFDATRTSRFATLTSLATIPDNTTISFATHTSPDGIGWSPWQDVAADGTVLSPVGRYVQYRATLGTNDSATTPRLDEVSVIYDAALDSTPPSVTGTAPTDGATNVDPDAAITVDYDEVIAPDSVAVAISGGATLTTTLADANRRLVLTPIGGLGQHRAYTVTVAAGVRDLAGNVSTTPFTFTFTTGARVHDWTDTTTADFTAGSHAGTMVTGVGDGALTLASAGLTDGFDQADGPAANWEVWRGLVSDTPLPAWDVQNGVYVHELNLTPPSYHPSVLSSALTPSGDFTMTARQRITQTGGGGSGALGFVWGGKTDRDYWWVQYAPGGYGGLKLYRLTAPLNISLVAQNLTLPFPVLDQWYDLELEVAGTTFKVYVDGQLQLTGTDPTYTPGRIGLLAYEGGRQEYDDVTVSGGYAPSGTYLSRIADAGRHATWQSLTTTGAIPAGAAVAVETRTADARDGSWSDWSAPGAAGAVTSPAGRYLQYRLTLSSTNRAVTPVVESVTARYTLDNTTPVATDDAYTIAEDGLLSAPAPGVLANDHDADTDPLIAEPVDAPAHGLLSLHDDGSFVYVPAADYSGTDTFTYRVSDGAATSAPATVTITVTSVNDPPTFGTLADRTNTEGDTVSLPLGRAVDPDGDALTYTATGLPPGLSMDASGIVTGTPTASTGSPYAVTVTADDGHGGTASATFTWTVVHLNRAPVATADTYATAEDATLTVAAPGVLGNDTDVDGDTLHASLVTAPAHGTLQLAADGSFVYTPAANWHGTDTFAYRAGDATSTSDATVTLDVSSVDDVPVVTNPGDQTTTIGTPVHLTLIASDPDADAVTFSATGLPSGVTIAPDGTISGTPTTTNGSPFAVTVLADDGHGGSASTTFTWTVLPRVDHAPVANADSHTTSEDTALRVAAPGVLGNDTDADGDALTAALLAGPAHGTVTLAVDGSFTYTPAADFNGTDGFTYVASDGTIDVPAAVTITVTAVNDAPKARSDAYTTSRGQRLDVAAPGVLANDSDVDGTALRTTLVRGPSHGSLSLAANGGFSYTPSGAFSGTDTFTYRASDGTLSSATTTVTITVAAVAAPPYWPGWDIARGVMLRHNGPGGYTVDALGGIHAWGGAPTVTPGRYASWPWVGGAALTGDDNAGTVVDTGRGAWSFAIAGAAPKVDTSCTNTKAPVRGIALDPASRGAAATRNGVEIDGWGRMFRLCGSEAITTSRAPTWAGWDIARGVALLPGGTGGFVLDGFGGIHAFGKAKLLTSTGYWRGWDIARGIAIDGHGKGFVIDAWGGLHAFTYSTR